PMRIFVAAILIPLLTLPMGGQQRPGGQQKPSPTPPRPSSGAVTFTSNTSLVIVDVTVKDKSGNPVDALTKEDSSVTEDGKPQKVAVFEYQKLSMEPEPPPVVTLSEQVQIPKTPTTVITAESPGEIQYHNKRLLVFYLDFSSM